MPQAHRLRDAHYSTGQNCRGDIEPNLGSEALVGRPEYLLRILSVEQCLLNNSYSWGTHQNLHSRKNELRAGSFTLYINLDGLSEI